jgi:hypothetical protein
MDLKKSPSWAMDTRRKHPLYLLANAAPKAPRPQGPKAPRSSLAQRRGRPRSLFEKSQRCPRSPAVRCSPVRWKSCWISGDHHQMDRNHGNNINQHRFEPNQQPFYIYIYCVIECVRCKTREIYIYNYNYIIIYIYIISQSNDPTRPLCMPERCLGLGPQRSSGLLK